MAGRTAGQMQLKKKAFLESFRVTGIITESAAALGIPRSTIYRWQEMDDEFAAGFREAEIEATEHMEAEARRRAVVGTAKPVYQGGVKVGTIQEYSDTLLIFMLKARNPAKYREKYDGAPEGQQPLKTVDQAAYEAL